MTLKVRNPPKPENPRGFYLCTVDKDRNEIIFQCGPLPERELSLSSTGSVAERLVLTVEKGITRGLVFHSSYPCLEKGMLVAW